MKLTKETPDSINNMKELIALLHGYDFGMKKAGNGNGVAKVVGQNLQITDTYFYGGKEALEKLVANWTSSSSGTYAKFFKEDYGITFTLVSKNSDVGDSNGGTVTIVIKPTFGKKESKKSRKESTSYEKDLDDNKPIIVKGVKGMKSTPFTKKFKNMAAYDKWADSDDFGNYEVNQIMNESSNSLKIEALKLLDEAGRYNDYDGFGNRLGGASDEGEEDSSPVDYRKATYSVYIDKRMVKGGLPGNRATAYAAAIKKSKPTANVRIQMDI